MTAMAVLAGALGMMAGCSDPPQTTTTSYEQTTTSTAPAALPVPGMPGTVTTKTTNTQTMP
jgi:uncharacterized lipoprotein YajG